VPAGEFTGNSSVIPLVPRIMEQTVNEKQSLRQKISTRRAEVSTVELNDASDEIARSVMLLQPWRSASIVHIYVGSLPGEIRTDTLIRECLGSGRTVIVPVVVSLQAGTMRHVVLTNLSSLVRTPWGGLEPATGDDIDPETVDLVIVPGVAFDRQCRRLGMGGGFYDRFLSSTTAPTVGLAHECQIVERVPVEAHDTRLNWLVTPRRVVRTSHDWICAE
jgi:5-formyltetrahydrofolate cyclo-ligase